MSARPSRSSVTATVAGMDPATATSAGVIAQAGSKTTGAASRLLAFSWQSTTVRATVASDGSIAGGTVQFTVNGRPYGAPVEVGADGKASATLRGLSSGIYLVRAVFGGTASSTASTSNPAPLLVLF